ncbi:MAG: DNA primase [Polyangiaceae bacterium]
MLSAETIARVKERTDIAALIGETVRLTRRGRSMVGLCPFHKEKSPSFHVHPERGFYHCFGCQESGSAVDFVMKTNGLEFVEAVRMLAERAGIQIEEQRGNGAQDRAQRTERDELLGVMNLAASFYERCLGLASEGPRAPNPLAHYAIAELKKRGMPDLSASQKSEDDGAERWVATLASFRMGYAPAAWDSLATFLAQQGVSPALAERAGLLVAGQRGHYDRFRHRLMFAVLDPLGRTIAFSGRALATPSREDLARLGPSTPSYDGDPPAKYINSPESPIYHKGEQLFGLFQAKRGIRDRGEALLVEGNFDVVSLHARGVDHAVAPLGTAFTPEQAKLLKRFAPSVVVLFDGDAAGKKATRAARIPCKEGGLDAKVATLPDGVDPDDFVRKNGAKALVERLKTARGMLEFLSQDALDGERFDGAAMTERVARVKAVARLLAEEPDPNLRLMAKRFADQLSSQLVLGNSAVSDLGQLERLVEAALSQPAPSPTAPNRGAPAASNGRDGGSPNPHANRPAPQRALSAEDRLSQAVLGALLDQPELLQDADVIAALSSLDGDAALAVVAIRRGLLDASGGATAQPGAQVQRKSQGDVVDFLATLPRSIQSFAARRCACPIFDSPSEAKSELLENTSKLANLVRRRVDADEQRVLDRGGGVLDAESVELLRAREKRARRRLGLDD